MKQLQIGNVHIDSPLVLAPLAGISDLPYRLVNRSFGCRLAFTEMTGVSALVYRNEMTMKKLAAREQEGPLGIQILGRDTELIREALDVVAPYGFDIIDFNAACPVKKVASRGKGAGLLREPAKLQEILGVIVKHADVPVTVKIRSGWDETSINAVELAIRAQDAGVDGLFIHGRTRKQRYSGSVDYDIIRDVKKALSIPLIASGDALSPELIKKLFDETGCDGVAVARGALGNPWIFRETAGLLQTGSVAARASLDELTRAMREHLDLMIAFYGEKPGAIMFRKFFAWYARGMPIKELRGRAFQAATRDEMLQLVDDLRTLMCIC